MVWCCSQETLHETHEQKDLCACIADGSMRGPALALCSDTSYETVETTLAPQDTVFMYTDGIYEVTNRNDEEYGEVRLKEAAARFTDLPLADLFNSLLEDARHFAGGEGFDDDICLVGFRIKSLRS